MTRNRNFDAGFTVWIVYPMPVSVGDSLIYLETEIELFCEPDECVGCTSWWVSKMSIYASRSPDGALSMIDIPRGNTMFGRIVKWVEHNNAKNIDLAFGEWLMDREQSSVAS